MELSNYSKIFKALSNERRLKIFMMIYKQCCAPKEAEGGSEFQVKDGACCPAGGVVEKAFTKICGCMDLSKSTISHHFKELQNAGLITSEREGQTFRCRVNKDVVNSIKEFFKE
ncbi:MAG: helix-turn-helix transcriptional regulator [Candidatus Omnitrophica bacterium]|nr:helix-turn-helix transcriptional regulator [Candidatus Omnitrophota bacterium]